MEKVLSNNFSGLNLANYNREPLLSTAAVAKWLGVSTRTVCLWAECKEIPGIKIGRQWRFREGELRQWLETPSGEKVKMLPNQKAAPAPV